MGEQASRTNPFPSLLDVDSKWGEKEASGETPSKVAPTILDSEFVQNCVLPGNKSKGK